MGTMPCRSGELVSPLACHASYLPRLTRQRGKAMYHTFMRLSPQQQHLCALQQGEESFPYDIYYAVRLEGRLDVSRLGQAFSQLVERYEILRACFPRLPGLTLPVQVINGD